MVAAKGHLKKDHTGKRKRILRQRKKNLKKAAAQIKGTSLY